MDTLGLGLLLLVLGTIAGWFLKSFFPSYLAEKGKNLATKEDVEAITVKVERIRSQYAAELEEVRSRLEIESEVSAKRRAVYDNIVQAMGAFLSGRHATDEIKNQFLNEYGSMWLWGSDEVIRTLNEFLEINILQFQTRNAALQPLLRQAYASCVIAMRRDAGFPETQLDRGDYKFVSFAPDNHPPLTVAQISDDSLTPQTEVYLDGTVTFAVELPGNIAAHEREAAGYLAKIVGPVLGTGQVESDIWQNPANAPALQGIANTTGVPMPRLLEIAQGIRVKGSRVRGRIRGLSIPGFPSGA